MRNFAHPEAHGFRAFCVSDFWSPVISTGRDFLVGRPLRRVFCDVIYVPGGGVCASGWGYGGAGWKPLI